MVAVSNPVTTSISSQNCANGMPPLIALDPENLLTAPLRMGPFESSLARLRFPADAAKETDLRRKKSRSSPGYQNSVSFKDDADVYKEIMDAVEQKDAETIKRERIEALNHMAKKKSAEQTMLIERTVAIWEAEDQRDAAAIKAAVSRATLDAIQEAMEYREAATAIAATRASEKDCAAKAREKFYAERVASHLAITDRQARDFQLSPYKYAWKLPMEEQPDEAKMLHETTKLNATSEAKAAAARAAVDARKAAKARRHFSRQELFVRKEVLAAKKNLTPARESPLLDEIDREEAKKRLRVSRQMMLLDGLGSQVSLTQSTGAQELKDCQAAFTRESEKLVGVTNAIKLQKAADKLAASTAFSPAEGPVLAPQGPEPEPPNKVIRPQSRPADLSQLFHFERAEARFETADAEARLAYERRLEALKGSIGVMDADALKRFANSKNWAKKFEDEMDAERRRCEHDVVKSLKYMGEVEEIAAKANPATNTRLAAKKKVEATVEGAANLVTTTAAEAVVRAAEKVELEDAANIGRDVSKKNEERLIADAAASGLFAWRDNAHAPWRLSDPKEALRSLIDGRLAKGINLP